MNILFVLYIGFDQHGPSRHLMKAIMQEALRRGHHVRAIVRSRGGSDPDVPEEFSRDPAFQYAVIHDTALEKGALAKRYFEDIRHAFRCRRIYRDYKDVDAVFLQSNTSAIFPVTMLRKTLRRPVLFNVQNIFPIDALVLGQLSEKGIKGIAFRIFRAMQRAAYRKADALVTISEDMKETLLRETAPEERITVVYNWSYGDDPFEIPEEENLFLNAHPEVKGKFRIVFAGNLGKMVDPYIIAEAAERLLEYRDMQFVIIGAGNNMQKLKELAAEKKLVNLCFYPYQPAEFAPHNYAMAHVNINALPRGIITTCLPSKTATMLNCARPMVVAVEKDSDYARILQEVERCAVVDCGDTEGFVQAILEVYRSKDNADSPNAREVFRRYFSEENAKVYIDTLERLAEGS